MILDKKRLIVDWPQNAVPATIGPDKSVTEGSLLKPSFGADQAVGARDPEGNDMRPYRPCGHYLGQGAQAQPPGTSPACAITIHKTQGSEFPALLIPLSEGTTDSAVVFVSSRLGLIPEY